MKLQRQRIYALIVATTIMVTSVSIPTFAADNSNMKEEIVYAVLDGEGSANNLYVVNAITVKDGEVLDYGNYSSVRNLNTQDKIDMNGNEITTKTDSDKLYYEGVLANNELPWIINIKYKLNGQTVSVNDLAGKDGELEIEIDIKENKSLDSVFFDNYALQISTSLDTNKCTNIEAVGATIANVGENKGISYTKLPKKDANYKITTTVKDFEMSPISINAVLFSMNLDLSGLDNISDNLSPLQEAISKLNEATTILEDGANGLLEGMETLDSNSYTLINGSTSVYNGLGMLKTAAEKTKDLTAENGPISTLKKASESYLQGVSSLAGNTSALVEASNNIYTGLQNSNTALTTIATDTEETKNLLTALSAMNNPQVNGLIKIYNTKMAAVANVNAGLTTLTTEYDTFNKSMALLKEGIDKLSVSYGQINTGILSLSESLSAITELSTAIETIYNEYGNFDNGLKSYINGYEKIVSGYKNLNSAISEISSAITELNNSTSNLDTELEDKINSSLEEFETKDFKPLSFVSSKNTNVNSVQFVMKTNEIKKENTKNTLEEKAEKLSFAQKLKNLFTK